MLENVQFENASGSRWPDHASFVPICKAHSAFAHARRCKEALFPARGHRAAAMQHRCERPKGSPLGVPPIAPKMSGLRQDVYFHEGIARRAVNP